MKEDSIIEVENYRKLLKTILRRESDAMGHPKIKDVIEEIICAVKQGEKTLVFCERTETIKTLRQKISEYWDKEMLLRWQKLFPGSTREDIWGSYEHDGTTKGKQSYLQSRFRKSQDSLYLSLRENYIYTIYNLPGGILKDSDTILKEANRILTKARTTSSSAKRIDYRLVKRCIEQAVFRIVKNDFPEINKAIKHSAPNALQAYKNIIAQGYPELGLDLKTDEAEGDEEGNKKPTWTISNRLFNSVLSPNRKGIWYPFREKVNQLAPEIRVRLVEGIASFLTRREVKFLVDLLDQTNTRRSDLSNSGAIRDTLETWWLEPNNPWRRKIGEFLDYFLELNDSRQELVLKEALKTGKVVSDTLDTETRERVKEAFNTPFYPMIMIGNRVMQEGLDLHRNCRRIIHHDMVWNPAQLEQRVGRLDRIGCLVIRERELGNQKSFLEIYYPLVQRSIDIRLYQVVKEREKWLNFLLGTLPDNFDHYDLTEHPSIPLPPDLANDLTVRLQPN